ncbi:LysR family transcriptional regulator [Saccharibacillus sp. O23]|uniref:cidABC operon transcriptional activator CidR n=1 Tax=Saccharibacillus sp. O23 TaxID=2009338 RepID=UPI000B4DFC21|nr:LysR family transcriptional regulator [Saccharibacillus sp. O23]OWR31717.1 LysR family transcriptional regulator [Saccharibacillus sp. O23]
MDIRHLHYFLETARLRSFTRAAESLYLSQPAISKAIRQLEEELGVTLFDRIGKKIELTDAGRVVVEQAQAITQSFSNLSAQLGDLADLKRGQIRIGLPPMVGSSFFPKVIGAFHDRYPDVTLQVFEDGAKKVESDVAEGRLDIGVVVLPLTFDVFDSFQFAEERLNLIVPASHPLAGSASATLAGLAQENFVFFREDFTLHDRIINECLQAGFHPRIVYESSQWDLISEMVAAGLGVALLPETICRQASGKAVAVVPMEEPSIWWRLGVIWHKDRYQSYAAREWISFTREWLGGTPVEDTRK